MNNRAYAALAALLAWVVYAATVSAGSYWLDGGEIVAATVALDIIHPPGHPLAALWGKAFTWLPLGSLSARVALGQAAAGSIGIAFFARGLLRATEATGLPLMLRGALAIAGSGVLAFCYGYWFQAVRPEVYALQGALLLIASERMTALVATDFRDARPLYAACVATGLGLANHHLMAFFFFPVLAYGAGMVALRRHALRLALGSTPGSTPGSTLGSTLGVLARSMAAGGLGLVTYVYLPLRALAEPPLNLGNPTTLERIYWVVSAKVYRREMGDDNPQPLAERFLDVLVVLVEQFGALVLILACVGGYAALRDRAQRASGVLFWLIASSVLLVRPWLGPVRGNPDSVGYLLAGLAGVVALAVLGISSLLSLASAARQGALWTRLACALLAASALVMQLRAHARDSSLAAFQATDAFDTVRYRDLPPRTIVVATTPQTVFRHLELAVVERARPDVALVPLPFLRYPGVTETLLRREPVVAPLCKAYLARDTLDALAMAKLAAMRPVRVELDTRHFNPRHYEVLLPEGALYEVRARGGPIAWPERVARQDRSHRALRRALAEASRDPEVMRALLWLRYTDALYFAALGQRDAALRSLRAGALLYPLDQHLQAFLSALVAADARAPFDVSPFLRLDTRAPPGT